MIRCPRDKMSFDKLDSQHKHEVKKDLLITNTDKISSILNPGQVLVKLYSKKLMDSTKFENLRKLDDIRNANNVITEALEQLPRHHHREKPPWWERFDAVLKETDNMDLFGDMNPWLDRSDHGAADGPMPDQIRPGQSNRGTPYSPGTPLFHTEGMADFLAELCKHGTLWRQLARHLGLTLQDELCLKNCQEDLHTRLVDAYAERRGHRATVGGLTRALTQLGDEGRDVVLYMEDSGVIRPMDRHGSEATGVTMTRNDSDGETLGGASAVTSCNPCHVERRFRDPSSSGGSGFLNSSPSGSHHVPRNPRYLGSRTDHRRSAADPSSDTAGNHTGHLTLTSATAVEATRSDAVCSSLQQHSSSKRCPERTSTRLAQQSLSLETNAEQESDRSLSTDVTDREQRTLKAPLSCRQQAALDQATLSVNQASELFDLQTDCGDALAFNEKSARNTNGVATRSTDTLPTEDEEPSANTHPKEYWREAPRETALPNENKEKEDAPNQRDHELGPGTQNTYYFDHIGNVFIGRTSAAFTNEPAQESHTRHTNHLRNPQEDPLLHSSGSATTDDTLVSLSSTQPEPWNLEAHETQPKYVTGVQESQNDEAATEEHSNLMTSTDSVRDHQNEVDVQNMSLAQEPTLQKYPPDDARYDQVNDSEPNVGLGAQTHHPAPKEREGFFHSLRGFAMEFVDGWLFLE